MTYHMLPGDRRTPLAAATLHATGLNPASSHPGTANIHSRGLRRVHMSTNDALKMLTYMTAQHWLSQVSWQGSGPVQQSMQLGNHC